VFFRGRMDFRHNSPLKIISIVVLAFFIWTFGGLFDIAYAIKSSDSFTTPEYNKKGKRPEEKFQDTLNDIKDILEDRAIDIKTRKNNLKLKKKYIESLEDDIKTQFSTTEEKIKGLPDVIQNRHRDFVKHYQDNLKELKKNLDAIEKAKTDTEIETEIEKTKGFLKKIKPLKKHTPLDPNKLPHRSPEKRAVKLEERKFEPENLKPLKLREKRAEFGEKGFIKEFFVTDEDNPGPEPFMVAASGSLDNLLAQAVGEPAPQHAPPADADLAETVEIQFTPAITAKAEELEHNPLKIYNWVRNNIEFVPTYGSIQGADYCLQTRLCNAFDTASLTIALLRASGIHSRYVTGTVEIPIEKVINWAGGFIDSMSALNLFASAGIPVAGQLVGGDIAYALIEHVWVEAWIDYFPSRGTRHKTGEGDLWVRMDTSFKQYTFTPGMDIQSAVPFDAETFIDQIISTATINEEDGYATAVDSLFIQQTMEDYQVQVENYINQNYPDATVGDVLGKKEIIVKDFPFIPGTLPFRMISKDDIYTEIPGYLRHKILFYVVKDIYDQELGTPLNITKSLPEIAGKKITLSYAPATQADENAISSYLPDPHEDGSPITPEELPSSLPAYLIHVKPELKIDGEVVATGTVVGLGMTEDFTMAFSGPGLNAHDVIKNDIQAGEFYGIALDLGRISQEQMQELKTKLETTKTKLELEDFTGLTKDDILGDLLYTTALSYYAELDVMDHVQSKTMNLLAIRLPSEAHFSTELSVYSIFGTPMSVSANGMAMDVDRIMTMVKAFDGDSEKPIQFFLSSGANGSALEHSVPEQLFSTPENPVEGISAVKALQIANDQGVPIFNVNQDNIDAVMPQLQLDGETKTDIRNAVNSGKEVTVQKSDITYNGWTGHGYIVIDPTTGAGAYMIAGGLSGAVVMMFVGAFLIFIGLLAATTLVGIIIAAVALFIGLTLFLSGLAIFFNNLTSAESEYYRCMLPILISNLFSVILGLYGATYIMSILLTLFDLASTTNGIATAIQCIDDYIKTL
jgi:transglutaminase-like putative cysteine protease